MSIPYRAVSFDPYWGPQTSAVNFCEEDYIITPYIGEFINTLSSLLYVGYGIHGIERQKRHDVKLFSTSNLPYWGLIGVGIFSGLYHTTLKYHTQMTDELSMHVATGMIMIKLFTFEKPPAIQRRNVAVILGVLIPFYIYHCVADEFLLHVILFGAMVITGGRKTRGLIARRIPQAAHRRLLSNLATFGNLCALFAFLLWNIDNLFCSTLTYWKRQVGMPWAFVFELHGWWHIFTGISAYTSMSLVEFLTTPSDDTYRGLRFAWPVKTVFEDVVPNKAIPDGTGNLHEKDS